MRRAPASLASLPLIAALGGCLALPERPPEAPGPGWAAGVVFDDRDGDGARDSGERGIAGVAVSNGRDVVRSDGDGRYRLALGDEGIVFVVKPRGWSPPRDGNQIPRFYYVHKPRGSPAGLAHPGVAPTGPLPASLDFPLRRTPEAERFRAIVFADTQTYDLRQIDYLARDAVEELVGTDAAFGITLGDVVGDDLGLFEPLDRTIGRIGIPWYHVHGNHDMNFRAADDAHADETWERVYGPADYAFQFGSVHFVVLDDVIYHGARDDGSAGPYEGGLAPRQMDFVRNYLAGVPRDELVVIALHIPLDAGRLGGVSQRGELLGILGDRPHTLSLSGHTHYQESRFFGAADGFRGARPHLHLNVGAISGSWWGGALDELGIPHATMRCGTPNGYTILSFDGPRYAARFKAARWPADYQMHVFAPDRVPAAAAGGVEVLVNVFAGSERSRVEMRVAGGDWSTLQRVERPDPYYLALLERESALEPPVPLPPAMPSPHLWVGTLPADPRPGAALIEVRATDLFGQRDVARRVIHFE